MAKPRTQHHSQTQRRRDDTRVFRSDYADAELDKLIAAVARDVFPDSPERLGQDLFNKNAPRLAAALGLPTPPKANAIYMRFNPRKQNGARRSWKTIVADALAASGTAERRRTAATREEPAWFQDESYVVYSLRRVADHLGIDPGTGGPSDTAYDKARGELELDRKLRRGGLLEDLLLTSHQIKVLASEVGWDGALDLAGYLPPGKVEPIRGFDPLKMLAHYYETKPGLPRSYEELRQHAATMDIPLPPQKTISFTDLRAKFIAARQAAGLETPREGPVAGQEMRPDQIAALLDGAPRLHRKGYWLVLDHVLDALAEYVELYDGKEPLRQRHYRAVAATHGWPTPSKIHSCAVANAIGTGPGAGPFPAMIDLARRRLRERRRAA